MRLLSLSTVSFAALAAVAGATLAASDAAAQTALEGIVVQGASLDAWPAGAGGPGTEGLPIEAVGSSVSVVTAADIERQQIRTAADALRSLPGVSISQQGTAGNVTVARIRGGESRHTLVLIDGVEVNSGTDGFFDFSNLDAADIERIEVLRGPQSGLYGSSALGGVISITTKSGEGPLRLRVQAEGGTQKSGGVTAQLSGGNKTAWGSVVVHGDTTDGFNISPIGSENDGTRIKSFAARGGVALSDSFKIEGTLRQQNTRAGYDEGFAQIYKGFYAPADAPYISDVRLRVGSLQATLDTFGKTWTHNFYLQGTDTVRDDFTPGAFTSFAETTSTNTKFGYKSTLLLQTSPASPFRHFVTGMVERRTETFEQPAFSSNEYSRDRNSFVGEVRGEYFRSLYLSGTVRRDQNSDTDDYTTWHAAASYNVPGGMFRLHASAGSGVKYPSFGDLYGFFSGFTPNPNLRPEESVGWDAGVETTLLKGRVVVDTTYFHSDLTNEISISCPPPTFNCSAFNMSGPSMREGLEVAARYRVTPDLTLGAAYTYLRAREYTGIEEVRRPPHSGRFDANYAFMQGRGNLNFAAIYNGRMTDIVTDAGFNSLYTTLDSYWLLRLAASYKLQPGIEVFGRVENILDDKYQEVFGYVASPGLGVFGGIKLTFGGPDGLAFAAAN
ncbi:MAG: TonB-dependent receptor plug domain-containing protein [Hyphomicrobiaceae bacterium]